MGYRCVWLCYNFWYYEIVGSRPKDYLQMTDAPDLAELFSRDPMSLTRDDILASLPAWRQARARFNLTGKDAPVKDPVKPSKKLVDLSALGLTKK